ncbi:alpha/beta hydrolase [Sphingobium sp. JS3065]|uniref:alpha/beta hydrolase n=1 Tax=Sphingobium sp. JS3065 TaxID=2970925 RepID=UPI00226450A8|nr:alpha/beta hydrolase [Sphingobium sp. JS3065]UZW54345.1 alpha/beta hydrolase [Sphingobium sp. JS3065]
MTPRMSGSCARRQNRLQLKETNFMALDPALQQILDQLPIPSGEIDFPALRKQTLSMTSLFHGPEGPIEIGHVENNDLPSLAGSVPIRIFRPAGTPRGTLHLLHGGGWAMGSIDFIEPLARRLTRDLSMVVVASGYRLAPEHPFPAGFEDSLAAARWVLDHVGELGGAAHPVVIGGESAGGNLAAAIALELRSGASKNFDAQLLFYPAVDLRSEADAYPSRLANADPSLRTETFPQMMGSYCGGHDRADPRISPLAAERLDSLPPAVVVVLTVDPLRDEAVAYADRLREAGVVVDLVEFEHLTHGFPNLSALVPAAAKATAAVVERLEELLARAAMTA